jgi:hypothetical protein
VGQGPLGCRAVLLCPTGDLNKTRNETSAISLNGPLQREKAAVSTYSDILSVQVSLLNLDSGDNHDQLQRRDEQAVGGSGKARSNNKLCRNRQPQ